DNYLNQLLADGFSAEDWAAIVAAYGGGKAGMIVQELQDHGNIKAWGEVMTRIATDSLPRPTDNPSNRDYRKRIIAARDRVVALLSGAASNPTADKAFAVIRRAGEPGGLEEMRILLWSENVF